MASEDAFLRTILLIVVVILLVPFFAMVLAMPLMGVWGMGHAWTGTVATWTWVLPWLTALAVVAAVGYLLFRAIRRPGERATDPALEELRVAYARGEFSEEEFERRRDRLRREREEPR